MGSHENQLQRRLKNAKFGHFSYISVFTSLEFTSKVINWLQFKIIGILFDRNSLRFDKNKSKADTKVSEINIFSTVFLTWVDSSALFSVQSVINQRELWLEWRTPLITVDKLFHQSSVCAHTIRHDILANLQMINIW